MASFQNKKLVFLSCFILFIGILALISLRRPQNKPQQGVTVQEVTQKEQEMPQESTQSRKAVETVAQNLKIPWDIVFLPASPNRNPDYKRSRPLYFGRKYIKRPQGDCLRHPWCRQPRRRPDCLWPR